MMVEFHFIFRESGYSDARVNKNYAILLRIIFSIFTRNDHKFGNKHGIFWEMIILYVENEKSEWL